MTQEDFLRNYPRLNIGPSKGDKRFYFETHNGVSVVVCDTYDGKKQPSEDLENYLKRLVMKYIDAEEITPIMAEYVADVFSRREHLDNISYDYCMEIADVFRRYAERAKQEQPSEDMEREIERFLASEESTSHTNAGGYDVAFKDTVKIARHFYELGKQAMKEQMKPIRVVAAEDAWETDGVVYAPKLRIVDDGCEDAIVVPGFNEEFTLYKENEK